MKNLIKLEEFSLFILSFLSFLYFGGTWYIFFITLLLPDLGMIGYLLNNKVGAITYNLTHHKSIAVITLIIGFTIPSNLLILAAIILFAHSSIDRVLNYGLKYPDNFKHTHLSE